VRRIVYQSPRQSEEHRFGQLQQNFDCFQWRHRSLWIYQLSVNSDAGINHNYIFQSLEKLFWCFHVNIIEDMQFDSSGWKHKNWKVGLCWIALMDYNSISWIGVRLRIRSQDPTLTSYLLSRFWKCSFAKDSSKSKVAIYHLCICLTLKW